VLRANTGGHVSIARPHHTQANSCDGCPRTNKDAQQPAATLLYKHLGTEHHGDPDGYVSFSVYCLSISVAGLVFAWLTPSPSDQHPSAMELYFATLNGSEHFINNVSL
jgi:hypothetical protein